MFCDICAKPQRFLTWPVISRDICPQGTDAFLAVAVVNLCVLDSCVSLQILKGVELF